MPANLDTGLYVREPAWHGEGNVIADYPGSFEEARQLCQPKPLTWEPDDGLVLAQMQDDAALREKVTRVLVEGSLKTADQIEAVMAAVGEAHPVIPGRKRLYRNDEPETTWNVVSDGFRHITNSEIGQILEAILQQPNVKYESLIAVNGGRQVAALVRLDEPITVPGDGSPTYPFLAVTTRHDGTGAARALSTTIRIVCWNTLSMAEAASDREGVVFYFEHWRHSDWSEQVEQARETILGLRRDAEDYSEMAAELSSLKVTPRQEKVFADAFIPAPLEAAAVSDRVLANIGEARKAVLEILGGPTVEGAGIRGTAYGLVQGATEYLDWVRGYQNKETLMGRQLLRPEKRKAVAVKLAREAALA